jgi:hypothetical protein
MKNRVFNAFLLLAMVGVMFTACKKEYPQPPIQDLPIGTVYTIDQILAMEPGTVFSEDASVYGIITADEQSGNLYKAAFMQDRATGAAIELYLNAVSGVRIGDSVRIYLKDVTYAMYNNLPQLSNFEADGHIIILANNKPIEPKLTTIANINAGQHLAGLVRLENVKFTEQNTFADPTTYGNRTLADPTDYSQTVIVRTSNYANFANDSLPQGTGNLVAIASVYNSTWQLYIRSAKELEFEGYVPGGDADLPYYQDFTSSFGTYTTYDVLGAQSWEIDYSTAKMTGYVNNTNYANEDWLISKQVSLEGVTNVSMTMSYIARYFNNLNDDITIQVSTDYTSGDPTLATWTQVPASWTSGSDWSTFSSTTLDLSQFAGQKVTVAVKYLSDDQKAGTIEVQSILIQEGSGPTPPPGTGGEVQSMPYTQSFATEFGTYITYDAYGDQSWEIDYNTAKMTGYVGGSYYANEDWLISSPVAITDVSEAKMTIYYIGRYFSNINEEIKICVSSNYSWGSDPTTASWIQLPVSLVEGSNWNDFIAAEISLTQFVGQTVTLALVYTSSNSKAGTMEVQSITIEEGGGSTPPTGGEVQSLPYAQSFTSEFGTYMTYDVLGGQSWEIDYNTAKMTGYVGGSYYANQDWLISSPVAITGVNDAKMTMVYIGRYFNNINEEVTIWASTNYTWGANPNMAGWTQVPAVLTEGSNWNDFIATEISLTDYVGQTVTFAVKYLSTDSKAGTMEIQSITIEEGSGVTPPDPPTPGIPEGSGTASDPYNVAAGIGQQSAEPIAWVHGYIVGAVKSGLSSVTSNSDVNWNAPFDLATNVVIADEVTCREISQCIIVNLPAGKPLRTEVNLMDNPGNLGKHLAVNGKLRKYFGQAGLRDSGGTVNDFVLEGGVTPPPQGDEIFSESFANGQGNFTIQDVLIPSELAYVWQHAPSYSCMKASAYVGQAYYAESWLVSPAINLTGVSAAKLSFEQAVNYASPQGALFVMISTDYSGEVLQATWTELSLSQWPSGSDWTFINSTADLTSYIGQNVTIAFKYTSNTSASATWEVKNFVVEE